MIKYNYFDDCRNYNKKFRKKQSVFAAKQKTPGF